MKSEKKIQNNWVATMPTLKLGAYDWQKKIYN